MKYTLIIQSDDKADLISIFSKIQTKPVRIRENDKTTEQVKLKDPDTGDIHILQREKSANRTAKPGNLEKRKCAYCGNEFQPPPEKQPFLRQKVHG